MASTSIATDSFTAADANPIGGTWTTITGQGAMQRVSNAITPASIAADSGARYNTGTWPEDQYAQLKITTVGTGATTGIGPLVRCSAAAFTCYGLYVCTSGANNVTIYKRVAGVFTSLGTRTQAFTAGDTFRIEVQGTTIRALYKAATATEFSVLGVSITDTAVASGSPGVAYSAAITSASGDDWEAGSLATLSNNYQFVKVGNGMSVSERIR